MFVRKLPPARTVRFTVLVLPCLSFGCGDWLQLDGVGGSRETLSLSSEITHFESGANDLLELADSIEWKSAEAVIQGSLRGEQDVDVYDLGPVDVGDHVRVSLVGNANLLAAMALFDDTGSSLLLNDHRNIYLGRQGPFIDLIFRRPSSSSLVAIAATPGYSSEGDYVLSASVGISALVPQPRSDVIVLNFAGARSVRIGARPAIDVPTFDAADISSAYDGLTAAMTAQIVRHVRHDFAGFDVAVLSTTEGAIADSTATRIHFGVYDQALLGIAEGVDEYNATSGQQAIVFTDTFAAFMRLNPSLEQMAHSIANVASHEIGHLLGLVHTADPVDIMDVTASLRQLLLDQQFDTAPLYQASFPIGSQDSVRLLLDAVGGDERLTKQLLDHRAMRAAESAQLAGPAVRVNTPLSGCALAEHQ